MNKESVLNGVTGYQDGSVTGYDVLEVFSSLIKANMLPEVGKEIRRTAEIMIEKGMISPAGTILLSREEVKERSNGNK